MHLLSVRASADTQRQFYGQQTVIGDSECKPADSGGCSSDVRPLTHDERNKLSARILKAEMKGNVVLF
jgi:hypothetical protein